MGDKVRKDGSEEGSRPASALATPAGPRVYVLRSGYKFGPEEDCTPRSAPAPVPGYSSDSDSDSGSGSSPRSGYGFGLCSGCGSRAYVPPFQRGFQGASEAAPKVPETRFVATKGAGKWQTSKRAYVPAPPLPEQLEQIEQQGGREQREQRHQLWSLELLERIWNGVDREKHEQRQRQEREEDERLWQFRRLERIEQRKQRELRQREQEEREEHEQSTAGHWGPSRRKWQPPIPKRVHNSQQPQQPQRREESAADRWGPSTRQWQPPAPRRLRNSPETQLQQPVAAQEPVTEAPQAFPEAPMEALMYMSSAADTITEIRRPIPRPPTFSAQILRLLQTTPKDLAAAEPRRCQNTTSETAGEPAPEQPANSSPQQVQTVTLGQTQPCNNAKPYTTVGVHLEVMDYNGAPAWRWFAYIKEQDDPEFEDKGEHYTGILLPDLPFADLSTFETAARNSVPGSIELDEDYLQTHYTVSQIRYLLETKKSEYFAKTWVHPYWTCVTRPRLVIDEDVINALDDNSKFCMEASNAIVRAPTETGEPIYYRYQQHADVKFHVIKFHDSIPGVDNPEGAFFGPIMSQVFIAKPRERWVRAGPHDLSGPYGEQTIPWYDDDMDDEVSDQWYGPSPADREKKGLYHDRRRRRKVWIVQKRVFMDRAPGYRQVPPPWYEM